MIIDLQRFISEERPYWEALEKVLDRLHQNPLLRLGLADVRRFHYLYERVSADLGRLSTFSSERDTRRYLESLVARAYGEIHETRRIPHRVRPLRWLLSTFPTAFRQHRKAFAVSCSVVLVGTLFGGLVLALDPEAKPILMPFAELLESPADRVAREEKTLADRLEGRKAQGAAWYMRNNTQVAITTLGLGITWGFGTIAMLFYTGVMLGSVGMDYIAAGQTRFLFAWLLPHGAIEIPAILLAGQAGLVLAGAMIGWGGSLPFRSRLRRIGPDLVTLIGGVTLMLIWAGIIEACLSQYHEPTIPYWLKISFGVVELVLLAAYLTLAGRSRTPPLTPLDTGPDAAAEPLP